MTDEMKEILDTIQESYKQGYKNALDKACDWLRSSTILADTTIERFKKAMEEQQ